MSKFLPPVNVILVNVRTPCKVRIKRSCHCGAMVHVFECLYYNSLPEKEQMTVRSCGGPCHRKLPYCTHLCPEMCLPGQCPAPDKCSKKVTVRCGFRTLKKEWCVKMFKQPITVPVVIQKIYPKISMDLDYL